MRMHVEIDGALVAQVDEIAGPRRRSAFVRDAVRDAVDRRRRQHVLRQAAGATEDTSGATTPPRGCSGSGPATRAGSVDAVLVLLDTTVLIDYLRGRPAVGRVDALIARGGVPCTTAVNVEEIFRGVRPAETVAVDLFFDGLRPAPTGRPEGRQAGYGAAGSRRRGRRCRRPTA